MNSTINIRALHTMEEMKQVQILEDLVWTGDSIPTHQTITAVKNGGIILGAYLGNELVGFNYGFPGYLNRKVYLCSHNMGIHPDYRGKGIGSKLKEMQKATARKMGYDLITWTFDPLETRNAYLNMSKLRAICDTYVENCYGEINDGLNNGLPTDRFKVEWWIDSEHIKTPYSFDGASIGNIPWEMTNDDWPKLAEFDISSFVGESIKVPVPANFQTLKRKDIELAIDWRMKTREIFQTLFGKGYAAVALEKGSDESVHYYVLVKRSTLTL